MRPPFVALVCLGLAPACTMESKFANDARKTVHVSIAHDGTTTMDGKVRLGIMSVPTSMVTPSLHSVSRAPSPE